MNDASKSVRSWPRAGLVAVALVAIVAVIAGATFRRSVEGTQTPAPPGRSVVTLENANGFEAVERAGGVDLVVKSPYREAAAGVAYRLIPRGGEADASAERLAIRVPCERIVAISTAHLPPLEMLGALDRVIAVGDASEICNPTIRQRLADKSVVEVGVARTLSPERVISLKPDVVFAYGVTASDQDAYRPLLAAGIPVVMVAEYIEATPLGRAEWIKFFALFVNREERAARVFGQIVMDYDDLRKKAAAAANRPTVLCGNSYQGSWYVPGGKSFMATFIRDAGGDYVYADDASRGVLTLDFESVLGKAKDANLWINSGPWRDLGEGLAEDSRYGIFRAFREGAVFNNNKKLSPGGGSDFWETGLARPDLILADLIQVFHPTLLPDRETIWYKKLGAGRN